MAAVPPAIGGPRRSTDVIWITGEFFGVQRARDMLYQLAAHKTNVSFDLHLITFNLNPGL